MDNGSTRERARLKRRWFDRVRDDIKGKGTIVWVGSVRPSYKHRPHIKVEQDEVK